MTVALAVRRIPPPLLVEARAACASLNLAIEDWAGGIPRTAPQIVISALEPGDRHLPEEICGLLEASPAVRAVVCTTEPLVKPRISLAGGRIVLLGPPVDRFRLSAVLRSALGETPPATHEGPGTRFEALRRQYWVGWSRGGKAPTVQIDEQHGLTAILSTNDVECRASAIGLIHRADNDARLEADLVTQLGSTGGIIHLVPDLSDWLIYWPAPARPLWIYSRHRIPSRWDLGSTFTPRTRPLIRLSAFPGDQIVAGWSAAANSGLFSALGDIPLEGGSETLAALENLTRQHADLGALVVEMR